MSRLRMWLRWTLSLFLATTLIAWATGYHWAVRIAHNDTASWILTSSDGYLEITRNTWETSAGSLGFYAAIIRDEDLEHQHHSNPFALFLWWSGWNTKTIRIPWFVMAIALGGSIYWNERMNAINKANAGSLNKGERVASKHAAG